MQKRLIFFGIFLSLFSLCLPPARAEAGHEKRERTLTVQGQGKMSAVPDIATLSVEVSHDGADLDPVLVQVRKEMGKVLDLVKVQGIADKDIQTEFFQVHPKYEQDKRANPHRVGFVVSNRISIKVRDLKRVGKILSAVVNAGGTSVDGPNFELDNPQLIERGALAAATKDAKAKAQAVAEAAGVQLGEIIAINPENVNWPVPPRPLMMRTMTLAAPMEAQEPIAAGEQTLAVAVTLTFAIH
jgi:uncharacterized protein YggE